MDMSKNISNVSKELSCDDNKEIDDIDINIDQKVD